jgi:uncharacterized membrane protein YvbJ
MAACSRCGKQNEPDARFCSACGLLGSRRQSALREQMLATLIEAGRPEGAVPWLEKAARLYERKESVVRIKQVRARLRELSPEPLAQRD